jgi:hypothetical protein
MEHTGAAKTILRPGALQIGLWYCLVSFQLGLVYPHKAAYRHCASPWAIIQLTSPNHGQAAIMDDAFYLPTFPVSHKETRARTSLSSYSQLF